MKKVFITSLVALFFAMPVLADSYTNQKPIKGGKGVKPPIVKPDPTPEPSVGGGGGCGFCLSPRVSAPLVVSGNTIHFLGNQLGYAYLEYEDGSRVYEMTLAVYHTLEAKPGKAKVYYVPFLGRELPAIYVDDVVIE